MLDVFPGCPAEASPLEDVANALSLPAGGAQVRRENNRTAGIDDFVRMGLGAGGGVWIGTGLRSSTDCFSPSDAHILGSRSLKKLGATPKKGVQRDRTQSGRGWNVGTAPPFHWRGKMPLVIF